MPPDAVDIRSTLIGDRKTFAEIAQALGCCERSVRNVVNKHHVPYIKVFGERLVEPERFREALLSQEKNAAARLPGRPRKAA